LRIVCKGEGEVMPFKNENPKDPRTRLIREKYFNIRPRPLECWLWSQGIPASAERVFWLHWQEGLQRGDWCSELPLRRVARECHLDVSTVTRAYQLLTKMGCIRRTDPGRNPANPFQQATAVTEVRLPRELLVELDQFPNRRATVKKAEDLEQGRGVEAECDPLPTAVVEEGAPCDPLAGFSGRDRVQALARLTQDMSASERHAYQEALRMHRARMTFDEESKLTGEARAAVMQVLASMAAATLPRIQERLPAGNGSAATRPTESGARKLSVFELARLKREIQTAASVAAAPELLRQVIWSIETGALRRFPTLHAVHIALKKIRGGAWTRPHRMPPNWTCTLSTPSTLETCRSA
jgi:hypothetical protein